MKSSLLRQEITVTIGRVMEHADKKYQDRLPKLAGEIVACRLFNLTQAQTAKRLKISKTEVGFRERTISRILANGLHNMTAKKTEKLEIPREIELMAENFAIKTVFNRVLGQLALYKVLSIVLMIGIILLTIAHYAEVGAL